MQGSSLVLLGWGMGGGLVLQAARWLPRLRGLVCVNGFYNGARVQQTVRGEEDWERFQGWVLEERTRAVTSGEPRRVDPFEIYPLDPVTRGYVDGVLRKNPGFGGEVDTVLADSLLDFAPEQRLEGLDRVPLLVAHGDQNALHPVDEARELHRRYPGPKQLYWVESGGHTEWMHDDDPKYRALAARIADWLDGLG
jgi:pimeloyl-ACP methyl ester carboxylesterase